jgi:hypothetical protein
MLAMQIVHNWVNAICMNLYMQLLLRFMHSQNVIILCARSHQMCVMVICFAKTVFVSYIFVYFIKKHFVCHRYAVWHMN